MPSQRQSSSSSSLPCVIWMTLASSAHYVGYEFARTATFALLTSPRHGFSNGWAVSLATACVSPCSMLLLWVYTRLYDAHGPRRALLATCVAFASLLLVCGSVLSWMIAADNGAGLSPPLPSAWSSWTRTLLFLLFTVQNAMVYLLSTQHWSFLGSVVTSPTQTSWAAGVGSACSTLGGMMAGGRFGSDLPTLLLGAGACLLVSAWCGDQAYRIAETDGLVLLQQGRSTGDVRSAKNGAKSHSLSLLQRARQIFARVPILGRLCLEVFCYQSQSCLINYLFVVAIKDSLVKDMDRAKHTASTYATINFGSGLLQFIGLPLLSWYGCMDLRFLWVGVPCIMTGAALFMVYTEDWSLWLVSASFVTMKTLEYSLRHSIMESLYTSLDQESRFVGKEIIAMCANRFGKSLVALLLVLVNLLLDDALPYIRMSLLFLSLTWIVASYRLLLVLRTKTTVDHAKFKED